MSKAFAWPNFAEDPAEPEANVTAAAREQARAEGYAAGLAEAQRETAQLHQTLRDSLATLAEAAGKLRADEAQGIAELVMAATRKLLLVELRTNPQVLQQLVAEALDALNAEVSRVTVLLNPEDHAQIAGDPSAFGALDLKVDAAVPLGGVSVRYERRSVEFDPVGRLEGFLQEEVGDGAAGVPAG